MNTERDKSDVPDVLTGDLEALRDATARDLPDIHQTIHLTERRHAARAGSREGVLMTTITRITSRPWWATGAAAAAIALVLLFVPVSYERNLGQEVTISVAGDLAEGSVRSIADAFRAAMGVDEIRLETGDNTILSARVPGRSRAEASVMARAFSSQLEHKGISATTAVSPWTEKVTGNVYAQVTNRWRDLRVETQGKSEAEIEQEIHAQLEQMGFLNREVTFRREGDTTRLGIRAENPDDQLETKIERKIIGGDGNEPPIEVALPDFSDLRGLRDDQVKAEIERRLRERGIEAEVRVENGQVEIKAKKEVREE